MLIQAQSYSTPEVLSEVPGWSSTVAWNGYTPPAQNVGSVIKTTRNEFDDPIENWGPPNDWYHSYRKAFAVYGMNQKCVFVRQSEAHVLTQSKPCRGLLSSDIEKYPRDISFPKRITEWTWAEDHYATSAIEKAASEALYERAKVLEPIYLQQSVSEFRRDNYGTIRKSNT